jgi:SPOR domain
MKVLKPAIVTFLLISIHYYSYSQSLDTGKVEIVQDIKVKELLDKHIEINSKAVINGYRIKIHFGADKNEAYEIKRKFSEKFPDVPAYAKYDQPNFNIRVGDFRTKLEAYKFLKEVQVEFPSAFLVQDDIEFPKLESGIKK